MIEFAGYTFADHKAALVCNHVRDGMPVLLFLHDTDGDIHFMCGAAGHDLNNLQVVGLSHLLEHIRSMPDMPTVEPGYLAEREHAGGAWNVSAAPD